MKLIIKFKVKRVKKKIYTFLTHYSELKRQRIYIDEKIIQKKIKRYKPICKFLNSKKYHKIVCDSEFFFLNPLKEDFETKYHNYFDYYIGLNNIIKKNDLLSAEFLTELNGLKMCPENKESIQVLFKRHHQTFEYILEGENKRLDIFDKILNYYHNIDKYLDIWHKLKFHYQETISFINLVKEYKQNYITNIRLQELKSYKKSIDFLMISEYQDEIAWNKIIIKKTNLFINDIDKHVQKSNFAYLDNELSSDILLKYRNDSLSKIDNLYYVKKINTLVKNFNVPLEDINNYFISKHSEIDDPFERKITNLLQNLFVDCKILTNTYFSTSMQNMPYCQIDIILFIKGDIFVLELKNYNGKIYGSYSAEEWKQIFVNKYRYQNRSKVYTRIEKQMFQNPIKQNNWHIVNLKKIYNYPYKNIVLFSNKSKLYVSANNVFYLKDFIKYLNNKEQLNSNDIINEIYYRLCILNNGKNKHVKEQHIRNIKQLHNEQTKKS